MIKKIIKLLMPLIIIITDLISIIFRLLPKKNNLVIFGAMAGNYYGDNSKYVFEYMHRNNPELNLVWMTRKKEIYEDLKERNLPVIFMYSFKSIIFLFRAKVGVYTNNLADISVFPTLAPSNLNLIALRHGRSVKKVRYAAAGKNISFSERYMIKKETNMIKAAISTSDFVSLIQEEVLKIGKEKHVVSGYPRNDALFKESNNEYLDSLTEKYKNIILYGPTWRHGESPVKFFPFEDMSAEDLNEVLIDNNALMILRPHKNELKNKIVSSQIDELCKFSNFKMLGHDIVPSVNDLLPICDLLICDYSALYHDYLLLNRPLMMIPYDYEKVSKSRGFLYDYYDNAPGPIISSYKDFRLELLNVFQDIDNFIENRNNLNNLIHKYQDSKSSSRVANLIIKNL